MARRLLYCGSICTRHHERRHEEHRSLRRHWATIQRPSSTAIPPFRICYPAAAAFSTRSSSCRFSRAPLHLSSCRRRSLSLLRHRQPIGGLWGAAHTIAALVKAATRTDEDFSRDARVPGAVPVHVLVLLTCAVGLDLVALPFRLEGVTDLLGYFF